MFRYRGINHRRHCDSATIVDGVVDVVVMWVIVMVVVVVVVVTPRHTFQIPSDDSSYTTMSNAFRGPSG